MMMSGKLTLNEVATKCVWPNEDEDPNMKADCFVHNNLQVIAFKALVDIQKDSEDLTILSDIICDSFASKNHTYTSKIIIYC